MPNLLYISGWLEELSAHSLTTANNNCKVHVMQICSCSFHFIFQQQLSRIIDFCGMTGIFSVCTVAVKEEFKLYAHFKSTGNSKTMYCKQGW